MFGLMEQLAALPGHDLQYGVVPTVVIPFAIIGIALSALATFIAGLFGISLQAEGPKKLLELFLKPRILLAALGLNLVILGGVYSLEYLKNTPRFLWYIKARNQGQPAPADRAYENAAAIPRNFPGDQVKDLKSIKLLWETEVPAGSFSGVVVAGNSLFFAANDGRVYEYDTGVGSLVRTFYVGTFIVPQPYIWENTLFVGEGDHATRNARIYAFDLLSGQLKGAFSTKGHTESNLRLIQVGNQSQLLFTAGADGVYSLDPRNLKLNWHFEDMVHSDSEVEYSDGIIFVSSGSEKGENFDGQKVVALDPTTGKAIWQQATAASGWHAPVLFEDKVCFALGEIYSHKNYGQLACYQQKTGQPIAAVNVNEVLMNYPIKISNSIVVTGHQGRLCGIDSSSWTTSWCHRTHEAHQTKDGTLRLAYNFTSPVSDSFGNLIFASLHQGILVMNPKTGETKFSWPPDEGLHQPWNQQTTVLTLEGTNLYSLDFQGPKIMLRKLRLIY